MNMVMTWLVVLIVMLVIEFGTMGLTTIWFGGGALVAMFVALIGGPVWLQVVLFLAVSIALLFLTRPLAKKYLNQRVIKTNADSLVGKEAVVIEQIDNLHSSGAVMINGQEWTARSKTEDVIIAKDEVVVIREISGVKLMVDRKN